MGRYMVNFNTFVTSMSEATWAKTMFSSCCIALSEFFGEDWWIIRMLLILIFTDFVLGITYAITKQGKLSGMKLHDGVVKLMAYCIAIILAWTVQNIVMHTIPIGIPILAFFAGYQSLTEIKSITRHINRLGIPMPSLFNRLFIETESKLDTAIENISPNVKTSSKEDSHQSPSDKHEEEHSM